MTEEERKLAEEAHSEDLLKSMSRHICIFSF